MNHQLSGVEAGSPDLSIVVPCFNESKRVDRLVAGVEDVAAASSGLRIQIVLVDDGSADDTAMRLRDLAVRLRALPAIVDAQVVSLPHNRGKGAALQAGVALSTGRWLLTADADMATPLTELLRWQHDGLVNLDEQPPASLFVASREHADSVVVDSGPRRLMGRVFNLLVQLFSNLRLTDTQCGFKLYPGEVGRALFARLRTRGWSHDVELLMAAERDGMQLVDLPVQWQAISDSRVRPVRDAFRMGAALAVIRARVWWRDDLGIGRAAGGQDHGWRRASAALLALLLVIVLATFLDYGVTWGEVAPQGGLFDTVAHLAGGMLPLPDFASRHLVNALVGLLGVAAAGRIARLAWGPRAGVVAVAALALTPTYYGHMFGNPVDVPLAAASAWGLYYVLRWLFELPSVSKGTVVKAALAIGLCSAISPSGLLLVGYLALATTSWLLTRAPADPGVWRVGWSAIALRLAVVGAVALLAVLICWSDGWAHPVFGPGGPVLFDGRILTPSGEGLPPSYVPWLAAIQLPLLHLVLLGVSVATVAIATLRANRLPWPAGLRGAVTLWCAMLLPLAWVILGGAPLHDNLRQLSFLLPVAAVLAAHGVEGVLGALNAPVARLGVLFVLGAHALLMARIYVSLHPYQYVYYNAIVGGVAGAAGDYETDYWAASYGEAALRLNEYARAQGYSPDRPMRVHVVGPSEAARRLFDQSVTFVDDAWMADAVLATAGALWRGDVSGREALRVERAGAPLAVVVEGGLARQ